MQQPIKDKNEALKRLTNAGQKLTALGIKNIGLFGSFIRENQTDESDVDVLVEFLPDGYSFDHFMELSFFLEELFGRKIDLVTIEGLSPYIGPYILREVERVRISA
jgi:predicted nucleotidyltransferase